MTSITKAWESWLMITTQLFFINQVVIHLQIFVARSVRGPRPSRYLARPLSNEATFWAQSKVGDVSRWNGLPAERWDTDTCQVLVVRVVIQVLKKQKSTKNTVSQIFSKSLLYKNMRLSKLPFFTKRIWITTTTATNSLSSADPPSPSHPFWKKVQQTLLQPSSSRTCHGRRAPNPKNWGSKTGSQNLMPPPSQGNFRTNFRKTSCGLDVEILMMTFDQKNSKIKTETHKTKQTLGELATAAIQTEVVCRFDKICHISPTSAGPHPLPCTSLTVPNCIWYCGLADFGDLVRQLQWHHLLSVKFFDIDHHWTLHRTPLFSLRVSPVCGTDTALTTPWCWVSSTPEEAPALKRVRCRCSGFTALATKRYSLKSAITYADSEHQKQRVLELKSLPC